VTPLTSSFTPIKTIDVHHGVQSTGHGSINNKSPTTAIYADMKDDEMEYKNAATSILSNFMSDEGKKKSSSEQKEDATETNPILSKINFNEPKFNQKISLETLAQILDYELYNKEWFVTGNVNPIYFSNDFEFQDPDVKLKGIEEYAKGVNRLFNQETARAEIISVEVADDDSDDSDDSDDRSKITITWRLSGKVNIGPGLVLKPYICFTDYIIDTSSDSSENGLIIFQEDRFDIPQWDILLSALFPFLIGKVTSDPAPPVPERDVLPVMPNLKSSSITSGSSSGNGFNLESVFGQFFK
jgi:hypothetical protein